MKMRTKMRMMKKRRREPRANDTIRMSKAAFWRHRTRKSSWQRQAQGWELHEHAVGHGEHAVGHGAVFTLAFMCRFASVPFCISFLQLTLDRAKERVQAELKKFRQAAIRGGSNGSISIALVVPTLCHPGPSCLDMVQWCCRKSMAAGQDDALAVRDLLRPTSTCAHSFWVISVDQEYDGGRLGFQGADETLCIWNTYEILWTSLEFVIICGALDDFFGLVGVAGVIIISALFRAAQALGHWLSRSAWSNSSPSSCGTWAAPSCHHLGQDSSRSIKIPQWPRCAMICHEQLRWRSF